APTLQRGSAQAATHRGARDAERHRSGTHAEPGYHRTPRSLPRSSVGARRPQRTAAPGTQSVTAVVPTQSLGTIEHPDRSHAPAWERAGRNAPRRQGRRASPQWYPRRAWVPSNTQIAPTLRRGSAQAATHRGAGTQSAPAVVPTQSVGTIEHPDRSHAPAWERAGSNAPRRQGRRASP